MLIGELADAAGLPTQTIRFYERRGLLPEPFEVSGPTSAANQDFAQMSSPLHLRTLYTVHQRDSPARDLRE